MTTKNTFERIIFWVLLVTVLVPMLLCMIYFVGDYFFGDDIEFWWAERKEAARQKSLDEWRANNSSDTTSGLSGSSPTCQSSPLSGSQGRSANFVVSMPDDVLKIAIEGSRLYEDAMRQDEKRKKVILGEKPQKATPKYKLLHKMELSDCKVGDIYELKDYMITFVAGDLVVAKNYNLFCTQSGQFRFEGLREYFDGDKIKNGTKVRYCGVTEALSSRWRTFAEVDEERLGGSKYKALDDMNMDKCVVGQVYELLDYTVTLGGGGWTIAVRRYLYPSQFLAIRLKGKRAYKVKERIERGTKVRYDGYSENESGRWMTFTEVD